MFGNRIAAAAIQTVFETIFPPQCLSCSAIVSAAGGLCPDCWRDTHFINGLICDKCGSPLPGDESDECVLCDDCIKIARPWDKGRAALVYIGAGRRLVLGLKHADRTEIANTAGRWMANSCCNIVKTTSIVAPIPLHSGRLFKRRYNQSALLAHELAKVHQIDVIPDLLTRTKKTKPLDGLSKDQRFALLSRAITVTPRFTGIIQDADVLLVDDVMTSGATFAAATEACFVAGANSVCIVALARVKKDA